MIGMVARVPSPLDVHFPATSPFYEDVRARVDAYFTSNGLARTADGGVLLKSAFWLALAIALYALMLAEWIPFPWSLPVAAFNGFALTCVGFNIGHDAIHGSTTRRRRVNRVLGLTFDLLGASSLTWAVIHNVLHHTYTNLCGVDQDIDAAPTLRLQPTVDGPRWFHRFQFIYAWLLYGAVALLWIFHKDFVQVCAPNPITGVRAGRATIAGVVLGKVVHLAIFIGVPLAVLQRPWWQVLVGYFLMMFCAGIALALVFELAHVVEGVAFASVPKDGRVRAAWADHQMTTTANFGHSRITTFITGGLNHQIEHHLFPRICHTHYPALAPIVRDCARDHGLPYLHSGSFFEAVASHGRALRQLGVAGVERDVPLPVTRAGARS
jgi:linoleoyl-CoA desaturase